MSAFNFADNCTVTQMLVPSSQTSTVDATSQGVDLVDYDADLLVIQHKGAGTGTLDGKIQDSATGSGGWADVAGLTFTQAGTSADLQKLSVPAHTTRRFVRYVGTIVTGPHQLGVTLVGVKRNV